MVVFDFDGVVVDSETLGNQALQRNLDPSDCVVIEDSATGARAAVAAKMPCYGYCAETTVDLMNPHCFATFSDMRILPKLLKL